MNKMWIKARICEILMDQASIHYANLMKEFDPSCHKTVILVLAEMYHGHHIWSTTGMIRWDTRNAKHSNGSVMFLCGMIANYAGVEWERESMVKWGVL